MANRRYKDSVFRMYFNNREELARLYQALRPDATIRPEDITINTLEDVLLDQQKNDLSFLWKDQSIVLTEHQSTISPNVPVRMLIYGCRLLMGTLADKKALYRRKLVPLPAMHFYELYIGSDMTEDERTLRLSAAYKEGGADLELVCHVINITYQENRPILQACQPLREYSLFVHRIEVNRRRGMPLDEAIREAIDYCVQHQIMQSFLEQCRVEVLQMMSLQWNADEARRVQEEERREDIQEVATKSKAEGKTEERTFMFRVWDMLQEKRPYQDIAREMKTTVEEVRQIAEHFGMAY